MTPAIKTFDRGVKINPNHWYLLYPVYYNFKNKPSKKSKKTLINRIDLTALGKTFTESARVATKFASSEKPLAMKESEHVSYVFNQGMPLTWWDSYLFQAPLDIAVAAHAPELSNVYPISSRPPVRITCSMCGALKQESLARLSRHRTTMTNPDLAELELYKPSWPGVTYFTDTTINWSDTLDSKIKIAIIFESSALRGDMVFVNGTTQTQMIVNHENNLDLIFTWDENLLKRDPNKYIFFTTEVATIELENHKMHDKSKLASMFVSSKKKFDGHKLRHTVAKEWIPKMGFSDKIEIFGPGVDNPIRLKSDGCKDFMFMIATENMKEKNYFSEKILDCFITGTIPIYWGAPNIGDFFDARGIITFDTESELKEILQNLTKEKYNSMLKYAKNNFEKTRDSYTNSDDTLYKKLIEYPNIREALSETNN